jgi:hypothetical protein
MMAKTQVIQLRAPRIPTTGALALRARRGARVAGRVAARVAHDQRHTLAAVGTAAALGWVARSGTQLPHLRALGVPGTYGLGALLVAAATKNAWAQHIASGALSVAAYEWARGPANTTVGEDADITI